jgi:hypothetical protein
MTGFFDRQSHYKYLDKFNSYDYNVAQLDR